MRLGILGGGGIGTTVAQAIQAGVLPGVHVVGVAGRSMPPSERVRHAAAVVGSTAISADELGESELDWLLEAAGVDAARKRVPRFLAQGCNAIIMSVGAMLDPDLQMAVERRRASGGAVELPSGAIGGLDAIRAMNVLGGLRSVSITTTKAPRGLVGAPYLAEKGVTLPTDRAQVIFKGTAREAIRGFPANANVTIALSIAGLGPDRTTVELVSDPRAKATSHNITAISDAGRLDLQVRARPHPDNAKTSYLAALSAVQAIKSHVAGVG